MSKSSFCLIPLFAAIALGLSSPSAHADNYRRVALVVGNSAYASRPLRNPVNDANDIGQALRELQFDVKVVTNGSRKELHRALQEFQQRLRGSTTIGFFYYAGHGMQVAGENYIIPIDANILTEADVEAEALRTSAILAQMQAAQNPINVIIMDACRDNPFVSSSRSSSRGLARMDAFTGSVVAYATRPGDVAADGDGRNGVYSTYLLKRLRTSESLVDMLLTVGLEVKQATGGRQEPWLSTSPIPKISLFPGGIPGVAMPAATPQVVRPSPSVVEQPELARTMDGYWTGHYSYPNGLQDVSIEIMLTGDTNAFSGKMSEPNTFGQRNAVKLFADVEGKYSGRNVWFTKQYDGTGGADHSVRYEGTLDASGTTLTGRWYLPEGSGRFVLRKSR